MHDKNILSSPKVLVTKTNKSNLDLTDVVLIHWTNVAVMYRVLIHWTNVAVLMSTKHWTVKGHELTELGKQRQDTPCKSRTGVGISSYFQQSIQTLTRENLS